ncbi:MAG: AAA-like domain-containing protein [Actinomycetota bacterium]
MTIEEVVQLFNASQLKPLTTLQEWLLRSSWEGKTYTSMAAEANYTEEYLRRIASDLWCSLSDFYGKSISKPNFRSILELRELTQEQRQLIQDFERFQAFIPPDFPSGPISLDSRFYIPRPPIEELAYSEITKPGSVLRVKASRKLGKSSLMVRIAAHATALNYRTAIVDFLQAEKALFSELNKFLRWFCANASRDLHLDLKLDDYWNEEIGTKVSCTIYFEEYLLKQIQSPLVLVLNEVNRVFEYPEIAQDFLPMLRFWHERATQFEIWKKLRLVVIYSTEIYIPLKLNQSPFNVGLPLKLPLFTLKQVQELAQRYGLDWMDSSRIKRLMAMVGGHPYLVQLAFYHLYRQEVTLKQLLEQPAIASGIYSAHLQQLLTILQQEPPLKEAFKKIIAANRPVKLEVMLTYKLDSMGLVLIQGDGCIPSCELYRRYFSAQLLDLKTPPAFSGEQLHHPKTSILKESVNTDSLTKIANRHAFEAYLEQEWRKLTIHQLPLSLILCDLDYFQVYNAACGHQAGDICLQQIANTICNIIQQFTSLPNSYQAMVARYGGEEFAVILPGVEAFSAFYIAEKLREEVKNLGLSRYSSQDSGFPGLVLTVSLGVACTIPNLEEAPSILVSAAEDALYRAKIEGRDRVSVSSTLDYGLLE